MAAERGNVGVRKYKIGSLPPALYVMLGIADALEVGVDG